MSQDYSDDIFGTDHQVQVDMQQIEDNFAALKSAFSGTSAPPDPVAGMWWLDTTTHLLKIRNEANSDWQSVWNCASNKPVITNLSGEITGAMISAAIKDAAAGTASLRTLGTAATAACAGNDARLSDTRTPTDGTVTEGKIGAGAVTEGKLGASAVAQAKLKTSTGEVSTITSGNLALPGGEYGFYPQLKRADGSTDTITASIANNYATPIVNVYYTNIFLAAVSGAYTAYAQQRYVTSSGEVFWIFFKRDKLTGRIVSSWAAPDHPCMGNGGKPLLVPHPFSNVDLSEFEIIVVNPDASGVAELTGKMAVADESKPDLSLLQIVNEQYEVDEKAGSPDWPSIPVTVGLPVGMDWKRVANDSLVVPVKKIIPRPEYALTRTLRLKGLKEI